MSNSNLKNFDNFYADLAQSSYRGRPVVFPYEKLRKGEASKNTGGERTDLQDIYRKEKITLPSEFSNSVVYGTSAGKDGLFTNNEAHFSYKWKGKTPKILYNNPIIKVQNRDLIIEKQIVGLKGEGYKVIENNKSKVGGVPEQKITELGKAILRDIKITVYEVQDDGTDKEYVSFKLYRDESLEDQGKELEFTVGNVLHALLKALRVVLIQPALPVERRVLVRVLEFFRFRTHIEDCVSACFHARAHFHCGEREITAPSRTKIV